jgi:hypothetical protein
MRGFGLVLLLLGVGCLGAAYFHADVPFLDALSDTNFWIIGGCLVALGAAVVSLTRDGD